MVPKILTLHLTWALPFLLVFISINIVTCNDESNKPQQELSKPKEECMSESSCPDGFTEIYTEIKKNENTTSKFCCTTDSTKAKEETIKAIGCRTTACNVPNTDYSSLCSTLVERRVDGKKMNYEMVAFDICYEQNEKEPGVVQALCCPPHSKEGTLTALLGAEKHQFPHFAILRVNKGENGKSKCGATIYNERFLVTAAHCVFSDEGKLRSANGSTVELDVQIANKKTNQTYEVKKFIPHKKYEKKDKKKLNDIALVELTENIDFVDNVRALPIAPKGFDPFKYSDEAVIIGVGRTDTFVGANMLQRANSPLSRDYKNIKYPGYHKEFSLTEADGLLFIGGRQNHKANPRTGKGDSGGPAICRDENGYAVLCGVNSHGPDMENCTNTPTNKRLCRPGIQTEVQHYHDWIVLKAGDQKKAKILRQPLYGESVRDDKYKHQVHIVTRIGEQHEHTCGGTLIEKDIIATAAHCVADDNGNPHKNISVTTGVRNVRKMSLGKKYDVTGVKILDGFRKIENSQKTKRIAMMRTLASPKYPYYKNDLALLKLTEEVDIDPKKLAKIGKAKKSTTDDFIWHTEVSLPLNTTKAGGGDLQQREFKLLQNDECQRRMDRVSQTSYGIEVDDNIMCGQEKYNGGSQCDRELGGGLICKNGKMEFLCGVQVFRYCQLALPNIFLDVSLYENWIMKAKSEFKK